MWKYDNKKIHEYAHKMKMADAILLIFWLLLE